MVMFQSRGYVWVWVVFWVDMQFLIVDLPLFAADMQFSCHWPKKWKEIVLFCKQDKKFAYLDRFKLEENKPFDNI